MLKKLPLTFSSYGVVGFCLLAFSFAIAQWSNDPSVNLQVSSWGVNPIAASDGNGGAFIGWAGLNAQWELDVYLQHVDKYGYVKWAQPIIIGGYGDNQGDATIVEDSGGTALLSFIDATAVDTIPPIVIYKSKVLVQKIDSLGNKLWGEGVRVSLDTTDQYFAKAIPDGQGGAIVIWKERDNYFSNNSHLFVQRVSAGQQRIWGDNGILIYSQVQDIPDIVTDNNGGAIFAYWTGSDYSFQRINGLGNSLWTTSFMTLGSLEMASYYAGIIISGTKYLVTHRSVIVNRISNDGQLIWGPNGLTLTDSIDSGVQGIPIIENIDSSLTFVWRNITLDSSNIFTQIVNPDGSIKLNQGGVLVSDFPSSKLLPKIVKSDSGVIYIWSDNRNGKSIYSQRLNLDGEAQWNINDVLVSNRDFLSLCLISDQRGGGIVIWHSGGIYAQQISKNGNLGEIITGLEDSGSMPNVEKFILHQNYPNPFNRSTTISYDIFHQGEIKLSIYNLLGKKIRQYNRFHVYPGTYQLRWDGTDQQDHPVSSGIYIYQLETQQGNYSRKLLYLK